MLIITKVDWIESDRNPAEIMNYMQQDEPIQVLTHEGADYVEASVFGEMAHGKRFVHPHRGIDVVLACDDKSGKLLGLQFDCWKRLEKQLEMYRKQNDLLTDKIKRINKMSLFDRIKFVFTKKMNNKR